MALAAVKNTETTAPTLADRLGEARRAEVRPRNRVAELEAALQAALDSKDYAAADRAQNDLGPAREALAIAQGTTRGLAEGLASIEAQRASGQQAADKTRREEEAQRIIGDAIQAERQGLDAIQEALAEMRACAGAARDKFLLAQQWETKVGQERERLISARVALGELQSPPPRPVRPNAATALADSDPLVRALLRWGGK